MTQSGFNITDLVREAQTRWLKPVEVLSILQNYNEDQLTHQSVEKPASGSLFLFNKRVLRFFRKDGHNWRKKKDGRTVGEAHERLKVGNVEALNCYYAHGEQNPNFQRRCYWILDPAHEHIVLVHYREIAELQGKPNSGTVFQLSPGSLLTYDQSPSSYTSQYPGSTSVIGEQYEPYQSPGGSLEVTSNIVVNSNGISMVDTQEINDEINVNQALRKLELQLSLNDESVEKFQNFYSENDNSNDLEDAINDNNRAGILPDDLQDLGLLQVTGGNGELNHQTGPQEFTAESEDSFYWNDMLDTFQSSPNLGFENRDKSEYVPQDLENFNFTAYSPVINSTRTYPNSFSLAFDQGQLGMNFESDSSLTISLNKKYTIREICPESGYASETTKVVIVGSFLCDPSIDTWTCMIGDVEVPAQIIQEGVLCCQAPPHLPGKVSLCITSNNRVSCSEIREFEYHVSPNTCTNCNSFQSEGSKSADEMLLLVRFVQMLLIQKGELSELGCYISDKSKSSEESWNHVIEALLFGTWTLSSTTDWLLQELLKDKLQVWLSSKSENGYDYQNYSLSKNEQGIIHMVAGLGYDWALDLILNSGVNINFRDINGWTGLHWAARFGREKMVAALLASGASAGVVTDPNSNDPIGQTPASIAATFGHKGLAGYLSEIALTSHLHSLTLQESKLSNDSADIEAENAVNTFSQSSLLENDDQLSLKDTLAAVRNTAQAAARIQAAFRAHSFRKRNDRETMSGYGDLDEYVVSSNDIRGISVASRMAFGPAREYNTAALSIQKKYRGWKGRKDYLSLRQKVVKIQAHFRGHQARKQYQVCWAVGILEKVVLRWRRKGVGLRGFRPEMESIDDSEDDDILKVFRKQKVDGAVDEAVSRVLSMVESPDARQQYRRMLGRFRQAKAERESIESEGSSTSHHDFFYMENEDRPQYQ